MRLFTLRLIPGRTPLLIPGIEVIVIDGKQDALPLAVIAGILPRKTRAVLNTENRPDVIEGKVHNAHFRLHNGKKFSDPASFLTVMKPNSTGNLIGIMCEKRWPEIGYEKVAGAPNGTVAPGLQIMKPMDSVSFKWEGKTYLIHNFSGEVSMSPVKETPATTVIVKEKVLKPTVMGHENVPAADTPLAGLKKLFNFKEKRSAKKDTSKVE